MRAPGKPTLRPERAADVAFLLALFIEDRAPEFASLPLPAAALRDLLCQQQLLQDRHYREAYPRARHFIILCGEQPVGRLVLDAAFPSHELVDLVIAPSWRGQGLGTAVLREAQAGAARAGRPLGLHVFATNPARVWYARHGFREETVPGAHVRMVWRPA